MLRNMDTKMPTGWHSPLKESLKLKLRINRKLGLRKAEKYFDLLNRFLTLKLTKSKFMKVCISTIGRENMCLHNSFLRSILRSACVLKPSLLLEQNKLGTPLNGRLLTGYHESNLQLLCRDFYPDFPRKGRTPKLCDRKVTKKNLAEHVSSPKIHDKQSSTEMLSSLGRPLHGVNSSEGGEEVDQSAKSPARSPTTAPLGISKNLKPTREASVCGSEFSVSAETCQRNGNLPDTSSLRNRLEQNLEKEGFKISIDFVNLLNSGLDVYLKRLIEPCMLIANSRSGNKHLKHQQCIEKQTGSVSASLLDFKVAMELNPRVLGNDWPIMFERFCLEVCED